MGDCHCPRRGCVENKSKIRVSRCDKDGKKTTYTIDLIEIGEKGRIEKDIVLRAGDVVWVPETWY